MKPRKPPTYPPPDLRISTTPARPRVATLHRVSSVLDRRQDPSLARDQLREHAAAIGDLVMEIEERGTGSKRDRPGLNQIMEAARRRRFEVLIVWRLDRLSRRTVDLHNLVTTLNAYGVELSVVTQPIDTRTPTGKLLFGVLALLAEHERDVIRERIMLGLERSRAKGRRPGPKKLAHPTVAQVVACRAAKKSWAQTAAELGANVNVCRLRYAEHVTGGAGRTR